MRSPGSSGDRGPERRSWCAHSLSPPWSIRIQDDAPLTVVAMVRGTGHLAAQPGFDRPLGAGEVVILSGGIHYTISDRPDAVPQVYIQPGQHCTTPSGESLSEVMNLGTRTWGNDPHGATVMLTGTYTTDGEVGKRLLDSIPPVIVVEGGDSTASIVDLLGREVTGDQPGSGVVVDRLVDLLLIAALRTWFAAPEVRLPAGYAALSDPIIGPALKLIQHEPHEPWTVASLGSRVGMSRARPSPAGSTKRSANHRCGSSTPGAWSSPPTCCPIQT